MNALSLDQSGLHAKVWFVATATVTLGIAVAWLAAVMLSLICRPLPAIAQTWEFEQARRIRLRLKCATYRWFEPLVDELTTRAFLHKLGGLASVRKSLLALNSDVPWTAEEFLAVKATEAFAIVSILGYFLSGNGLGFTIVICVVVWLGYLRLSVSQLHARARRRVARFRQRLPFGIDLIALMMAAGSGFRESAGTLVRENQGHPIGEEFGKLIRGLERGQSLRETLENLQFRLPDPDVKEMVFAIQKAEELGTPLSRVFFSMADQMRLKRSQWSEKAVGKAQTMITFPGLVIMVACLLIVTAPFVIDAVQHSPF